MLLFYNEIMSKLYKWNEFSNEPTEREQQLATIKEVMALERKAKHVSDYDQTDLTPCLSVADLTRQRKAFEYFLEAKATLPEICGLFHCEEFIVEEFCNATYNAPFIKVSSWYANGFNARIKRLELDIALNGNDKMAIFLGKSELGQTDEPRLASGGDTDVVIVHDYTASDNDVVNGENNIVDAQVLEKNNEGTK